MNQSIVFRPPRTRLIVAAGLAAAALVVTGLTLSWPLALLVAWDCFVATLLVLWFRDLRGHDAEATARIARRDDMTRGVTDVVLLGASLASLGGVFALLNAHESALAHGFVIALALVSIAVSWAFVHMVYTLRYAVLYYSGEAPGGVKFDDANSKPQFSDFVYLAFTIGMTYQVSDQELNTALFRRAALGHALLSFVFGTAIIATTINILAGLGQG